MTKIFMMMAAAGALVPSPAVAKDIAAASAPNERVAFADLDLLSSAGTRQLEARIRHAARNLCIENSVKSLAAKRLERDCYENAVADGIEQAGEIIEAQRARQTFASSGIAIRGK